MLHVLYLTGIAAFASSGVLAAHRARLDAFGGLVLAFVAAISGGTLRSLILGTNPVAWTHDGPLLTVIATTALVTMLYLRRRHLPEKLLDLVDAIGLAVVTVIGARAAIDADATPIAVLICAVLTGITGEVVRDLLCGERPPVLLREQIYATAALAGASLYLLLHHLHTGDSTAALVSAGLVLGLRLGAIYFDLHLPRLHTHQAPPTRADTQQPTAAPAPGNPCRPRPGKRRRPRTRPRAVTKTATRP